MLAVGAPESVDTVAAVGEPGIPTCPAVLTEAGHWDALVVGGCLHSALEPSLWGKRKGANEGKQ